MSKLKLPKEKELSVPELFGMLLNSGPQAHIFHLQTTSYAEHKALNDYYEGIVPLVDILAETYQGQHGIIKNYASYQMKDIGESSISFIESILAKTEKAKESLFTESDILNILDEITALMKQTLYKLKHLK